MPVATPERSLEQRMDALGRANEIRTRRKDLKIALRRGRVSVIHTIESETPDWLATMKVYDALVATPKIGRVKANRMLQRCRVSPSKTLAGLSSRQRKALVTDLRKSSPVAFQEQERIAEAVR